jgi:hypothetical protein
MLTDLITGRRLDRVADCQPVPGLLPPMISLEVDPAGFRKSQQERLAGESLPGQYLSDGGPFQWNPAQIRAG